MFDFSSNRDEAIEQYLTLGWAVIPLQPGIKMPYPGFRWGMDALPQTPPAKLVYAWFRRYPRAEVGILTGSRSGLVVIDIDPRNGGSRPLDLPTTLTAATPSGGTHLFYSARFSVRSTEPTPGVEIKAEGKLVVAPPAPGRAWIHDTGLATFPRGWGGSRRRAAGTRERASVPLGRDPQEWALQRLDHYAAQVETTGVGDRNNNLYRLTKDAVKDCHLSRARLDLQTIMDRMMEAGYRVAPEEERKHEPTVRSAIQSVRAEYEYQAA